MKTEVKEEEDEAAVKAEIAAVEADIVAEQAKQEQDFGVAELPGAATPPLEAEDEEEEAAASDDGVSYYANMHKFIYSYIHTHVSL